MWVRLDDGFFTHPKVLAAGKDATLLYLAGLTYSARKLTNGFIPQRAATICAAEVEADPSEAERLLHAGLWETAVGGYRIHDWHQYNMEAERYREARRAHAERQSAYRDRRSRDDAGRYLADERDGARDASRDSTPDPDPDPVLDPTPVPHAAAAAAAEPPIDERWQRSAAGRLQAIWREHMGDAARAPLTATQLRKGLDLELRAIEQGRAELVAEAMAYTAERGKPWMYFLTTLAGWLDGQDYRRQPASASAGLAPISYDFDARADRWLAAGSD